ncbi:hypothetical protein CIMG_08996 [Paecilomyces variotii No. 5]|uniref:BZIP domain-containing protein n=1 Tax=Byssochlamys spectabilis (strain No. 5 / NBRC 109023) TaxID=1356009 RepID=V5G4B3_BYSSN|nr:hypothetical protein CIMG_08996 [Paecilomyces variotii No. 5]
MANTQAGKADTEPEESLPEDPSCYQTEDAKAAAYSRRREQVRRAQRKHRQKKDNYIRVLEDELHKLYKMSTMSSQIQELVEENNILRAIIIRHKIPIPQEISHRQGRWAEVVVVGNDNPDQHLEVKIGNSKDAPLTTSFQRATTSLNCDESSISDTGRAPSMLSSPDASSGWSYGYSQSSVDEAVGTVYTGTAVTTPSASDIRSNPHSLSSYDLVQVGINFVLALEQPCLNHTRRPQIDEPSGHAMSMQGVLLADAPSTLAHNDGWKVPVSQFRKLFELAGCLGLDGYITPVQAWNRITSRPDLSSITLEHLVSLKEAMACYVKCFGFGAIIEEEIFEHLLNQTLSSPPSSGLLESSRPPAIYGSC